MISLITKTNANTLCCYLQEVNIYRENTANHEGVDDHQTCPWTKIYTQQSSDGTWHLLNQKLDTMDTNMTVDSKPINPRYILDAFKVGLSHKIRLK